MDERFFWLGISYFGEIGPVRFKLLYDYFRSAEMIWKADSQALVEIGLNRGLVDRFVAFRKDFDFEKVLKELSRKEIRFLTLEDEDYPYLLKQIPDAPNVIYIKGEIPKNDFLIGVVGTRMMTVYGFNACKKITEELVEKGIVIVSGMARGVDTVAHRAALEKCGKTVAVLGTGVDVIYPSENRELYYKIIENGAVVSEIPPGRTVEKGAFRLRNRIISGLSKGIIVIEGAIKSGSLITARYALEQGREVFAVPGPITSKMSEGPSYLISQGAKLATSASDILIEFNPVV